MSFITIDPYYPTSFYNETKEALKNNGVKFSEFISIKPPYNWCFDIAEKPIMVNYDEIKTPETRWLVNKVHALRPNEEYRLLRRDNDSTSTGILKYIENDALKSARTSDYAVWFTVKNREDVQNISRDYPGKIWYFGKYYRNKYRVCLATHSTVQNFLDEGQILLKKTNDHSEPGRFESDLNWKVFRGFDMLVKFTEMPYFEDGHYNKPKIEGDLSSRFYL